MSKPNSTLTLSEPCDCGAAPAPSSAGYGGGILNILSSASCKASFWPDFTSYKVRNMPSVIATRSVCTVHGTPTYVHQQLLSMPPHEIPVHPEVCFWLQEHTLQISVSLVVSDCLLFPSPRFGTSSYKCTVHALLLAAHPDKIPVFLLAFQCVSHIQN